MRYVDKNPSHDDMLTRGAEIGDEVEVDTYENFLDRRLIDEADLDFPEPYSYSRVLQ